MYYNVVYIQSCGSKKLLGCKMVTEVEGQRASVGMLRRIGSIFFPGEEAKSAVRLKVPGYQTCLILDASADEEIRGGHPSK